MAQAEKQAERDEHDEERNLFVWRFYGLRELGLSYVDSQALADRADVVHQAEALISKGCPPLTAAKILL